MRKKLLSILLVLSLMLALVPAAFATDAVRAELEIDGTTLAFYGSGTATADCWNGDWTAVTHIALGYEIRGVAEDVLARCVNLVSFETIKGLQTYNGGLISMDGRQMLAAPNRCTAYEIPDLVQTVKTGAFRYCQGLTAVTFPASLTTIEAQAFTSCLSLTAAALPDGLKTIGDFAFAGCAALTSVSIPEGITRLESHLFYNCTGLESISLPASLTSIGYLTFSGASNVKVVCYAGTEEQWKNISISVDTSTAKPSIPFDGAKICYEHPDHVFDPLTNTPATCTDDGRIAGTCTVCGYSMDTVLPAYGHIWDSGTLLTAPEGVRCGIVEHTCGRCNGTGYEVLDPEIWAYEQFGDVDPTLWSYEGIQFCVMMGYMSGMDTHVFAPRGVTTRAQLVQILYNFVGGPEVSGETPFTDLTANWYKDAVLWAYQTGVTSGTSETTFSPNDPVTREQVAVLLYKFADKVLEVGGAETPADLSRFPDGDQVSSWAREAMADAVALGIINGTKVDDQVFLAPQGSATRDQIATMFEGFCASLA